MGINKKDFLQISINKKTFSQKKSFFNTKKLRMICTNKKVHTKKEIFINDYK